MVTTLRSKIRPVLYQIIDGVGYGLFLIAFGIVAAICIIPTSPILILYAFYLWLEEKPVWEGLENVVLNVITQERHRGGF